MASGLGVANGLAPRWAAKQPQTSRRSTVWRTAFCLIGAAAQPNAGQARSPQKARASQSLSPYRPPRAVCGFSAVRKALQRKRRQNQVTRPPYAPLRKRFTQRRRVLEAMLLISHDLAVVRALAHDLMVGVRSSCLSRRGMPIHGICWWPRHCGHWNDQRPQRFGGQQRSTVGAGLPAIGACQRKHLPLIHRYRSTECAVVASRLALRRAAKRPQIQTLSSFWKTAVPLLGLLRSPTQGKPARHWRNGLPSKVV